jgi:preprotein translocase subunit SecA
MKIKGIVFDKDGTLLDYDKCWRPVTLATVEYVGSMFPGSDICREGIRKRLGVLPDGTMDIDGPHCRGFHDKIAGAFVDEYELRGIEFDKDELIREVGLQPTFDETTYKQANRAKLSELIVADLQALVARRAKAVADTVRPVMQQIYEQRKDNLEGNMYFPLTNGHLGYNVPVSLQKCKDTDGAEIFRAFTKVVMFTMIDDAWREHLREMDELRQSVQNASYEQKDPLLIYKFESFNLFAKMLEKINRDVLAVLNKAYIPVQQQNPESLQRARQQKAKVDVNKLQASRMAAAAAAGQAEKSKPAPIQVEKKVGRNDPCPCGSGKKYKHCHGK